MLQVRAETTDPGGDRITGLRMPADIARQGQEAQRSVEIDIGRRHPARQRDAFRLGAVLAFAELDIDAVGTLAQADRLVADGIDAEWFRAAVHCVTGFTVAGVLDRQWPRVAAIRVVRAADEGAELAELQAEASGAAARAKAWILAAAIVGEKMPPELFVQRRDHLGDRQLLGAVDSDGELLPEVAQHLLPIGAPARDVVELVLQIGGKIILQHPIREAPEASGDQSAARVP